MSDAKSEVARRTVRRSAAQKIAKKRPPATAVDHIDPRVGFDDDFVGLYRSGSLERIEVIKTGVRARSVGAFARKLNIPNERLVRMLGMAPATVSRKAKADGRLAVEDSARMVEMGRLIGQVTEMVAKSGNPEGFDAAKWVAQWIESPVPALGNRKPAEFLDTSEGQTLVSTIVARMQSGAYS